MPPPEEVSNRELPSDQTLAQVEPKTLTSKQSFCFCTLALGERYRTLATLLAKDLEAHAPDVLLLILTDQPGDFSHCANVLALRHQRQFLYIDNEKKCLIEKALSLFDRCICIDADVRILAPLPENLDWQPGITARSCTSLLKHRRSIAKKAKNLEVVEALAQKLDVDLADHDVKWVYEFLFVVAKSGQEAEFLEQFERAARYLEFHKIYMGAGSAIGLAAAKVGFPIRHDCMAGIEFFDDRIEREKIKKGEIQSQDKLAYFDEQNAIESRRRSTLEKVTAKLGKMLQHRYLSLRLRIISLSNFDFYYR